ncbi:hypothetical protein NW755_014098 [Fusarium falciforme]|uniref:Transcription factor domain-containing protein n=1 Tax=Fusarium falciforme TaxID=195108 RepID=A0A9W8USA0_9HYPO|nr:hypothetical protein NW755_014098 [Fusarium falciforme]
MDPHNLMQNLDQDLQGNSRRLTRRILRLLGEQFPVGQGNDAAPAVEASRGLHDLLPSITNIAKQGWNLDERGKAKRARRVAELPVAELPVEDSKLLEAWTPEALQETVSEVTRYFEYGLRGSKRDVARDLDPLQRGLITESKAQQLFQAFFDMVHPQWAMLDPQLHTLEFVRVQSALLTATILALGSIALATMPERTDEQVAEAMKLHAHAEKMSLVVYSTGARSIEIVQAQVLLSRFGLASRTRLDEQRWVRSAMIPRMAAEIDLMSHTPRGVEQDADPDLETQGWNCLRTRAFMILNEYRFFTFSGRAPVNLSYFELDDHEIDEITRLGADHPSSSLPALYHLYLFQNEVRRRLESTRTAAALATLQLKGDLVWVTDHTERWIATWAEGLKSRRIYWHLVHDALSCQLLLSSRIIGRLPQSSDMAQYQRHLLNISLRIFQCALATPHATHMTHRASTFAFAGAIILRFGDRRDMVLRLALRMAGDPCRACVPTANHGQPQPTAQPTEPSTETLVFSTPGLSPQQATATDQDDPKPQHRGQPGLQEQGSPASGDRHEHQYSPDHSTALQYLEDPPSWDSGAVEQPQAQSDTQPAEWTMLASHVPVFASPSVLNAGDPATSVGNFFNLDTSFDFPYVANSASPQNAVFSSHELVSDFEMLAGDTFIGPAGSATRQGIFDDILSAFDGPGSSTDAPQRSMFADAGEITAPDPGFNLDANGGLASLENALSLPESFAGVGNMNQSRGQQESRQVLYSIIGRLLQLASSG